jgi:hypothetical protein
VVNPKLLVGFFSVDHIQLNGPRQSEISQSVVNGTIQRQISRDYQVNRKVIGTGERQWQTLVR